MKIIDAHIPIVRPEIVILDFDGTISKLRAGWDIIMRDLMVEMIPGDKNEIKPLADAYVDESAGIPTIRQMEWLAEQVAARGGECRSAVFYKQEFAARMMLEVNRRKAAIRSGAEPAEKYTVPGSVAFLKALRDAGVPIILASGTDENDVRSEANALGVDTIFDEIHGADPVADICAKEETIRRVAGSVKKMLVAGDGKAEILMGREVGAVTLGVASWDVFDIPDDGMNPQKEKRLIQAGAHAVTADYRNLQEILNWI